MSKSRNSNLFPTLYTAACTYYQRGFSILPLRAKIAAIGWSEYQQRRATRDELHTWFVEQGHTGIGIVTGAISGLIVLDFDDPERLEAFQQQHPDLAATYTVKTRRGCHLYYHILKDLHVQSRAGRSVDLQAEGRYVVAPPTIIDGHRYRVSDDRIPHFLSQAEISRIEAFVADSGGDIALPITTPHEGLLSSKSDASQSLRKPQKPVETPHGLQQRYLYQSVRMGRNNALFAVSCQARDQGFGLYETIAALADLHAQQPGSNDHRPETQRQRTLEAMRTIHSAYSRPPQRTAQQGGAVGGFSNSVRERLFQIKQTYTVRVLEGLHLAGVQPGQHFTTAQALKLLAGQVGRDSIYNALNALMDSGEPVFERESPSGHPQTARYADKGLANSQTNKCILVAPKNQEKGHFHRPARVFIMPSNEELCRKLGVEITHSDPLDAKDITSAKKTRMAAHREMIRRRPGIYPRGFLSRRLGITKETIDTYNAEIPVFSRPTYYEKPISWRNLEDIPASLTVPGTFLEGDHGKRYPPKREIVRKLLAKGQQVTYKRRGPNFYWLDDPLTSAYAPPQAPSPQQHVPAPQTWPRPRSAPRIRPVPIYQQPLPVQSPQGTAFAPRMAIPDSQAAIDRMAERVYTTIDRLSPDRAGRISRVNARKLVECYGVAAVEHGLKRLEWYAGKGRVEKPVGFLITVTRVTWREQQGIGLEPRFRG